MSENPTPESTSPTNLEFSLDNRQVVFLFFGLAVVGCFVFGLGIMAGRRLDGSGGPTPMAMAEGSDPTLDGAPVAAQPSPTPVVPAPEHSPADLEFREGLSKPLATAIPATRPANVPPRPEKSVTPGSDRPASAKPESLKTTAPARIEPARAVVPSVAASKPAAQTGKFTLVVKSFSDQAQAQALAGLLRTRGYTVKVDPVTEKGKAAFRVRVGNYAQWDEGLAAKVAFEKAEKRVAWLTGAQAR